MVAEILKLLRERLNVASDKSILQHVHVYKCQCTLLTKSLLYFLLLRFIVAYDFPVFRNRGRRHEPKSSLLLFELSRSVCT